MKENSCQGRQNNLPQGCLHCSCKNCKCGAIAKQQLEVPHIVFIKTQLSCTDSYEAWTQLLNLEVVSISCGSDQNAENSNQRSIFFKQQSTGFRIPRIQALQLLNSDGQEVLSNLSDLGLQSLYSHILLSPPSSLSLTKVSTCLYSHRPIKFSQLLRFQYILSLGTLRNY